MLPHVLNHAVNICSDFRSLSPVDCYGFHSRTLEFFVETGVNVVRVLKHACQLVE